MKILIEALKIYSVGRHAEKCVFFISKLVRSYPKEEQFSIVDNMKRAARSTTQNIAEGSGRFHYKENLQFCRISRGSLFELTDDLITSIDEGLISKKDYELGRSKIADALALLNGYIKYLDGKAHPQTNNE